MQTGQNLLAWGRRLLCAAVTGGVLWFVFRRLDLKHLAHTMRAMHWGWFILAFVAYGLLFLPASWRWHIVLCRVGRSVHPLATARLSLIGHFLYTIFFGAIGGDSGKAILYARWYGWSLPDIMATAPLDRLLGFVGLLVFASVAFSIAGMSGGFSQLSLSFAWPGRGVIGIILLVMLTLFALKRFNSDSPLSRFFRACWMGGKLLFSSSRVALTGIMCGLLVQLALGAVMALNLQAISVTIVPWNKLIWTFPIITILSALPLTVAGLGAREGAAMALLGLYAVPREDAVAASLLTVVVSLSWACAGAVLCAREAKKQRRRWQPVVSISVVIPMMNAESSIQKIIERWRGVPEVCEILVADSGTCDCTTEIAAGLGCRVVRPASVWCSLVRLASAEAKGDAVLLLPCLSGFIPKAPKAVLDCLRDQSVVAGRFWRTPRNTMSFSAKTCFVRALCLVLCPRIFENEPVFVRKQALERIQSHEAFSHAEKAELVRLLGQLGRFAVTNADENPTGPVSQSDNLVRSYRHIWASQR